MVSILQAIILGLVQGITEWLPVSSSGHLVLLQQFFGINQPIIFDVILHLGSLIVLIYFLRKEITQLIKGVLKKDKKSIQYILLILLATIPIGITGTLLNTQIKNAFNDIDFVAKGLIFTSLILLLSQYPKKKSKQINIHNAFQIGLFQALAVFPGISRSGMTLSSSLFNGVKPKNAAKFSFLLFIPAILGATIIEAKNVNQITNTTPLIIATIMTIISGYYSLKLLNKIINKQKIHYFSIYCFTLGIILLSI